MSGDGTRWSDVRRLFEEALDVPAAGRAAFVRDATTTDADLRTEVERLLALHEAEEREGSAAPPGAADLLSALASGTPLAPGARVGSWRLLARLGEGAMGEVWEAEQDRPHRRAALKVVRAGRPGTRARLRFRDEIDALARLRHPGIARILEAGEHVEPGGEVRPWYAMELVPGARTLGTLADGPGLPWREAVELVRRVCEAVEHGHRHGVIHRDLKPGNILLGADGRPRVIDFGVARITAGDADLASRTQAGELVGTLASMAPEQLEGRADVRSDVYALGVVLHELLTGRPPYDLRGLPLSEAARRVREATPAPPGTARAGLPVELDWIVARALEKDPEARYPSAAALAEDLRRLLAHEPVEAGAPTAGYRLRKFVRRHRVGVALAALILLLLVGGIAGTTAGMLRAQDKERDALVAQGLAERRELEAQAAATREAEARGLEARARADAEAAAAEAVAVTRFLVDMFDRADPAQDGSDVRVYDALDAAEARLGGFLEEHPRAEATLRGALGDLDYKLGRYAQAEAQLRRALEVQRGRGLTGPEALDTEQKLRHDLGQALAELRRYDEADAELQAVVDARRAEPDLHDERLANALNALAYLRHRQGRLDEAEALYREGLAVVEAARGPGHVDAARIQANLGGLLLERRRIADAEPLLTSALETLRRELGADHPLAIAALNNLGGIRFQQRRYAEAAELMQEAWEIRSRRLPPDHRVLLDTKANLATLRWALGEPDEAARMLEEVLAARLAKDPAHHPELVTMLCNLASMVKPRGDEAVRDVVRRLQDADVGTRADNVRSVQPIENLARFLEQWGLLAEALALLDESTAARERLQPAGTPEALLARGYRARLLAGEGRADEARAELSALRAAAQDALSADDPRRAALDLDAGRAWLQLGAIAEAEVLLLEAEALLRPAGPAEQLRLALSSLAACCESGGRADEAGQWRERLAALSGGEAPR